MPYNQLPDLLGSADCHLVIQKGAADAVLPSVDNILAVGGNSVITASPDTTLGKLRKDFLKLLFWWNLSQLKLL